MENKIVVKNKKSEKLSAECLFELLLFDLIVRMEWYLDICVS